MGVHDTPESVFMMGQNMQPLWVYVATAVLIAVLVMFALNKDFWGNLIARMERVSTLEATNKVVKEVETKSNSANVAEKKLTYTLIERAVQNASMVCKEIKEMKTKQLRMFLRMELTGNRAGTDQIKKIVNEQEVNINEFIKKYLDVIVKLTEMEHGIVTDEFKNHRNLLLRTDSRQNIKLLGMVELHYQESLNKQFDINVNIMTDACSEFLPEYELKTLEETIKQYRVKMKH